MALSDSAGLLFRIRADSSDATKELAKVETGLLTLDKAALASGEGLSAFGGPAAIAVTAITAIGTAAAAAVAGLFRLAESASEYGSAIHDAADQTGLSAETISALKYAADTSGSSLEKITGSVAKFSTLVGQAKDGNEKAADTLKKYGITATETDAALAQAVQTIAEMDDTSRQSAAAAALFKDRTGEILPVIKAFDGDLPGLMDKLREMGLLMSDQDAAAADQFGDSLDTLKMQLESIARAVGIAVMPVFQEFFVNLSNWITTNQVYIKAFAQSVGDAMSFIVARVKEAGDVLKVLALVVSGNFAEAAALLVSSGILHAQGSLVHGEGAGWRVGSGPRVLPESGGDSRRRERSGQDEADQLAKRDYTAQLRGAMNNLGLAGQDVDDTLKDIVTRLQELGTSDAVVAMLAKEFQRLETNINVNITALEALENQKRETNTVEENGLLTQEQRIRRDEWQAKIEKAREEFKKLVATEDKNRGEAAEKTLEEQILLTQRLLREEERRQEIQKLIYDGTLLKRPTVYGMDDKDQDPYYFGLGQSWETFKDSVLSDGPKVGEVIAEIGSIGVNAFQGLANALGSVVEQWVLTGETGPAVMRKILASALAAIAAEAAVRAIFELAKGFAALFLNPAEAAAHFKAAALFGAAAVAAGVTGRAIAGDAFKQQANTATGSSSQSSSSRNVQGQGKEYSGQPNQVVEQGRNAPGMHVKIHLSVERDSLLKILKSDVSNNGPIRGLMIDTVAT